MKYFGGKDQKISFLKVFYDTFLTLLVKISKQHLLRLFYSHSIISKLIVGRHLHGHVWQIGWVLLHRHIPVDIRHLFGLLILNWRLFLDWRQIDDGLISFFFDRSFFCLFFHLELLHPSFSPLLPNLLLAFQLLNFRFSYDFFVCLSCLPFMLLLIFFKETTFLLKGFQDQASTSRSKVEMGCCFGFAPFLLKHKINELFSALSQKIHTLRVYLRYLRGVRGILLLSKYIL